MRQGELKIDQQGFINHIDSLFRSTRRGTSYMLIAIFILLYLQYTAEGPFPYHPQANHVDGIEYEVIGDDIMIKGVSLSQGNGASMQSELWDGNILLLDKDYKEIKAGNMILYEHNGGLTVHRIESVYSNYITTTSDFYPFDKQKVEYEDIKGLVVGVIYN